MARLYVGLVAPKTYEVNIVVGDSSLDLSLVSDATIEVRKPDGTTTSWAVDLSNQTSTTLKLTYDFGETSPLDQPGTWRFYAKLTVVGGYDRTEEWVEEVFLEHGS
jgi:hypothetical protein